MFRRHVEAVHRYLSRLAGAERAEDLTQTVFTSLTRAHGRVARGASARLFLYATATHAARAAGRTVRPESSGVAEEAALSTLPRTEREAVLLHRVEGLTFAELAQVLELSMASVQRRTRRGYARFRSALARHQEAVS